MDSLKGNAPIPTAKWQEYYQALADGRFKITAPALVAFAHTHPDRILDTYLWARPAKVLLLDKPLKLGEKVPASDLNEYFLRRLRLNELPGWPPKLASTVHASEAPALLDCTLKKVSYVPGTGPGQGGILYGLEHAGRRFQAWQVDCPVPLLTAVESTLNLDGSIGLKLIDLQDIRLVGTE